MHVIIVEEAGFCFGVRRALDMADDAIRKEALSATLGPLIHNPQVVEDLQAQGVRVVEQVADMQPDETLMVRTHGCSPEVYEQAREQGIKLLDATCPFVSRAQREAERLCDEGLQVFILGEPEHPEARSIREHTGGRATIVETPADTDGMQIGPHVGVVCQTTQRIDRLTELVAALLPRTRTLTVSNTICNATTQRQEASLHVAKCVDVMVVVGGYHSANTTRLAQICSEVNPRTYHIERAEQLRPEWTESACSVGITAGASTPNRAIEAVHAAICRLAGEEQTP